MKFSTQVYRAMFKRIRRFVRSNSGSVALTTGIALPVMTALGLGALDYGLALKKKQALENAANKAALAAISEAHIAYKNLENVDLATVIREMGRTSFYANAGRLDMIDEVSLTVTPEVDINEFKVKIEYTYNYNTQFMKFVNQDTIQLGGEANATEIATIYANVNLLFDVSASMGVGASAADQQIMGDTINCAFACHIAGHGQPPSKYQRSRDAGATMRIDVARTAAIAGIDHVEETANRPEQVTFSIHTFDNVPTEVVPVNDPQKADLDYIRTRIQNDVMMNNLMGGTNIELALQDIAPKVPASGSGRTPDDRVQYVIVLTDGVESAQARTSAGWVFHEDAVVNNPYQIYAGHEGNYALRTNANGCQALEGKNVRKYFIYTEYLAPEYGALNSNDVQRFGFIRDTLFDIIPQRFADCTGDPNNVIRATTPEEIDDAFRRILGKLTSPLRLL
ncbi:MAG: pilus assembly protein TadG-related protein [Ahrensia sp.]|nr:pilus assembly protein TadG-related protein [Ahrensia sp.]